MLESSQTVKYRSHWQWTLGRNPQNLVQWPSFSLGEYCFGMWWYVGKPHWIPCWFANAKTAGQSNENIIRPVNVGKECTDLKGKSLYQISHSGAEMSNTCSEKLSNNQRIPQSGRRRKKNSDCCNETKRWHCATGMHGRNHIYRCERSVLSVFPYYL